VNKREGSEGTKEKGGDGTGPQIFEHGYAYVRWFSERRTTSLCSYTLNRRRRSFVCVCVIVDNGLADQPQRCPTSADYVNRQLSVSSRQKYLHV